MRVLILLVAVVLPSSANADSCITMEGSALINGCQACMEVTAREPGVEQAAGMFTGESRTVRLEAGARETLQGGERWAITDLRPCH